MADTNRSQAARVLVLVLVLVASRAPAAVAHGGMILLALDTSGNGNDLEPVNAYRDPAPAKYNNAMTFNGTTSYLQRVNGGAIISNSRMTVCTWIKPNTNTGTHSVIHQDGGLYLNQTNLDVLAQVRWTSGGASPVESSQGVTASNALVFGVWKHVCVVVDNTAAAGTQTTITIFVEGAQAAQSSFVTGTGSMLSAKATLYLGGVPGGTGVANAYNGWLDDTVWCTAFAATASQILTIRNTDGTGNAGSVCGANLKGLWKFDELVTGAPNTAPASGYLDPANFTCESPCSRWMHVRGDTSTLELRIDLDGDGVNDRAVTGNVWDERVTWTKVGTYLFHVQFIDQFGRAQHNETTITIRAPTSPAAVLSPKDTTGGKPLTRLVTLEGDSRVVNIKVDYEGDGVFDAEVNNSTFGATHTWSTPGTYRLNVQYTNDANVSGYRESIITVLDTDAPTATIYPEPGLLGTAPVTRWVVVRGDATVRQIRVDFTGDGTWDATENARSLNVQHTWDHPGIARLVVQVENEQHVNGTYDVPLRIENDLVQDPLTSDRTCGFCDFGDGAKSWNDLDPTFSPQEVWNWLVFIALVAVAGFVLYFRIINGGT